MSVNELYLFFDCSTIISITGSEKVLRLYKEQNIKYINSIEEK